MLTQLRQLSNRSRWTLDRIQSGYTIVRPGPSWPIWDRRSFPDHDSAEQSLIPTQGWSAEDRDVNGNNRENKTRHKTCKGGFSATNDPVQSGSVPFKIQLNTTTEGLNIFWVSEFLVVTFLSLYRPAGTAVVTRKPAPRQQHREMMVGGAKNDCD